MAKLGKPKSDELTLWVVVPRLLPYAEISVIARVASDASSVRPVAPVPLICSVADVYQLLQGS